MEFTEALKKVYKSSRKKEQLNDPFLLYSRISDLIGDSYNEKKKAKTFFSISKKINLLELVGEYGKNCRSEIIKKYDEVSEIVTKEVFNKLVDMVYELFFPPQKKPVTTVRKKAKVIKSKEPEKTETRTPLNVSHKKAACKMYIGDVIEKVFITALTIIGIAAVPFIVGLAIYGVECLYGNVPWEIRQWVIGVIGVIAVFVIMFYIGYRLDSEVILDFFVFGTFALYIVGILNFVAKLFFAEYLMPFFICVSVGLFLVGIFLVHATFEDIEEGWGWAQIISVILNGLFVGAVFVFNIT